jgi:hypothetical protein
MKKEWAIYDSDVGTLHLQPLSMVFAHHLVYQEYRVGDAKLVVVIVR